jgi:hypothetical protein
MYSSRLARVDVSEQDSAGVARPLRKGPGHTDAGRFTKLSVIPTPCTPASLNPAAITMVYESIVLSHWLFSCVHLQAAGEPTRGSQHPDAEPLPRAVQAQCHSVRGGAGGRREGRSGPC